MLDKDMSITLYKFGPQFSGELMLHSMTILSFIGIFAVISGGAATLPQSLIMIIGIFSGSMTWWLILGTIIIKIKHKLPEIGLIRI